MSGVGGMGEDIGMGRVGTTLGIGGDADDNVLLDGCFTFSYANAVAAALASVAKTQPDNRELLRSKLAQRNDTTNGAGEHEVPTGAAAVDVD